MDMRALTISLLAVALAGGVFAFQQKSTKSEKIGSLLVDNASPVRKDKVVKTAAQWKKALTPDQYNILRESGTERAYSGKLLHITQPGTFVCTGCGLPLFTTKAKFDSGTGWPSFYEAVARPNVWLKSDHDLGMERVEVRCSRCDGHLGHVFDDGPADKTGLRFCINSPALKFIPAKKKA